MRWSHGAYIHIKFAELFFPQSQDAVLPSPHFSIPVPVLPTFALALLRATQFGLHNSVPFGSDSSASGIAECCFSAYFMLFYFQMNIIFMTL